MAVDMSGLLTQKIENGKVVDTSASATSKSQKSEKTGTDTLDKMDFINLLVAEMQNQDPLEPSSNTDYVAQMAQFSQVEALDSMKSAMQDMEASGLVGKTVVISTTSAAGYVSEIEGKVDYVQYENGKTYLSVNGDLYSMDDLKYVIDDEFYEANEISDQFTSMIEDLPNADDVTLADYNDVAKAVSVRDSLTAYQKGFIDQAVLDRLAAIEERMGNLISEAASALSEAVSETGAEEAAETASEETAAETTVDAE